MMRLTRSISLLLIVALSSFIWSAAQVDWDDDVYYVPSQAAQQNSRSNDLWGDEKIQYDNQDELDAYNHRGKEYTGERGRSYSSSQKQKGVGKYSRRIMRFHNPATVNIYDSDNVDVYYNEDGTYGIYNYPDRYDYVADRYNPLGISINLWSPGWYPSWDYYYDYMWDSPWYPWYTNRYSYPYSWGGYNYWGPSIWYTNPWSWGGSYWYGYYPHYGGYGSGYNNGYWDGYYAGSYGIYDPYYGSYVKPSTYYSNGRLGSSYYDKSNSSNPRTSRGNQGTLSGNARRGSLDASTYNRNEVADRGNFWKDDRNRIYDNSQRRSARGSYDQSGSARRSSSEQYSLGSARSRRGSYFEDNSTIDRQLSSPSRSYDTGSTRSRRGSYDSPRNSSWQSSSSSTTSSSSSRSYDIGSARSRRGSYDSPSNSSWQSSSRSSSSSSSFGSSSSSSSSSSGSARGRR